jgi:outer membrane protein assembly factor BamB
MIEVARGAAQSPAAVTGEIRLSSAHPGPVNCVTVARLSDGRVVLATAGGDGTLRRFDAASGLLLGEALGSNNRRMLSVAAATLPDGRVVLAAGGDDGIVRRVDATTGRRIGSGMTGHAGTVWSVSSATLRDGQVILATGGNDRTVRRFDAATGRAIGEPLVGHTDWVRALASARLADGRVILATGSDDGTVRRYDAETGEQIGEPLTGHSEWVRCVTTVTLPDGTVMLASGGGDGVVWRYDAATGEPLGEPLVNDTRRVLSMATVTMPDGTVLLLTGGGDGAARCFDAATGQPLSAPIPRHGDALLSITAAALSDGRVMLASAGADGALVLSSLELTRRTDPPPPGTAPRQRSAAEDRLEVETQPDAALMLPAGERIGPLALVDSSTGPDGLGRDVLAGHLHGTLTQLVAAQDGAAVAVHVDGRSGSGKSNLIALLLRRLQAPQGGPEDAASALRHPVVAEYDAWRERESEAPALTLARAIDRAIRRERAGVTGIAMTFLAALRRASRTPSVLAPLLIGVLVLALAGSARPGGIWSLGATGARIAVPVLAALGAACALALAAGVVLCWSASTFGKLGAATLKESPGELAAGVARLRRWTPRRTASQRLADTVFGLAVLLVLSFATALVTSNALARESTALGLRWVAGNAFPLLIAAVGAALVAGLWDWSADGVGRLSARGPTQSADSPAGPRVTVIAVTAMVLFVAFAVRTPDPVLRLVSVHPEAWTAVLLLGTCIGYALWTASVTTTPRRPVLLVIDNLDRCSADRVVGVLEAVHTMLRATAAPRVLRRWRAPAPLVVFVAADGRWLRAAVEERYPGFDGLSSSVRGLGADFVQAVFDHTVLVPPLSAPQVQAYAAALLGGTATRRPGGRVRGIGVARSRTALIPRARQPHDEAAPAGGRTERRWTLRDVVRRAAGRPTATSRTPEAITAASARDAGQAEAGAPASAPAPERAQLEAGEEATATRTHHLLERYTTLLPTNPRLVKRVANTWGMLLAVQAHLGHAEDQDSLARAAILLVRFPALVDVLLSATSAPQTDPGALSGHERSSSAWLRPDVQQVLHTEDGDPVSILSIARCYGREFPEPPG